jgi:hypothetical protein
MKPLNGASTVPQRFSPIPNNPLKTLSLDACLNGASTVLAVVRKLLKTFALDGPRRSLSATESPIALARARSLSLGRSQALGCFLRMPLSDGGEHRKAARTEPK